MATLLSPRRFIPSLRHLTPSRSKIRVRDLSFTFRVTTRSLTQLGSSSMSRSTTESEPEPQNDVKESREFRRGVGAVCGVKERPDRHVADGECGNTGMPCLCFFHLVTQGGSPYSSVL
ncbi:hypothetical protein OIU84_000070 [Salix udensis]|uniref:Uncharacterized protein n=1 Tax=Salix udensis TaxID=889485 RepID=A0AAD6PLZ2_9ROSI|nr:hypothetical protein OIU84_000070 [Salix udensis]